MKSRQTRHYPDEMSGGDTQHLCCLAPYQIEKEISIILTSWCVSKCAVKLPSGTMGCGESDP